MSNFRQRRRRARGAAEESDRPRSEDGSFSDPDYVVNLSAHAVDVARRAWRGPVDPPVWFKVMRSLMLAVFISFGVAMAFALISLVLKVFD